MPIDSAGSHCTAGRQDREIKPLSQPWSPALREPQALGQPSTQIEDWEPSDQSPPGGIMPRGVNQEVSPVLQPCATEVAGNI